MGLRRFELFAQGFDPTLQALGGAPDGFAIGPGLRVPFLATTSHANRYLFQVATYQIPQGKCARVVSIKQGMRIGLNTSVGRDAPPPAYPLLLTVRDPLWRFVDGNVSWHLRLVRNPLNENLLQDPLNSDSFRKRWCASGSGLVFETATFNAANLNAQGQPDNYTLLTAYTPPFAGTIPGEPVCGLGTWQDLRFPYDNDSKQNLDGSAFYGGGALVLYASVHQPSTAHTATITVPAMFSMPVANLSEEAFLEAWPPTQYWTVLGALGIEEDDLHQ